MPSLGRYFRLTGTFIDLSEKNPLVMLRNDASLTTLLEIFSRGTHRVLVEGPEQQLQGIITDSTLVKYFASNVGTNHTLPTGMRLT